MLRLIVLLLAALVLWKLLQPDRVELGPGVLGAADPVQTAIDSAPVIRRAEYRITPLAEFQIRAKVLSRESYYLSLIHISEPTRPRRQSRMPSWA